MKKLTVLLTLVVLVLASSAFAQRAFQLRLSLPSPGLGLGIEADIQRNIVAQFYGDLLFVGPDFLIGGDILFKPDLGQFDRDLRGISPFIGGGMSVFLISPVEFALNLTGGVEFELDRNTGLFISGQGLYFIGGGLASRVILGATLR